MTPVTAEPMINSLASKTLILARVEFYLSTLIVNCFIQNINFVMNVKVLIPNSWQSGLCLDISVWCRRSTLRHKRNLIRKNLLV